MQALGGREINLPCFFTVRTIVARIKVFLIAVGAFSFFFRIFSMQANAVSYLGSNFPTGTDAYPVPSETQSCSVFRVAVTRIIQNRIFPLPRRSEDDNSATFYIRLLAYPLKGIQTLVTHNISQ